jgi:hypothetical protein
VSTIPVVLTKIKVPPTSKGAQTRIHAKLSRRTTMKIQIDNPQIAAQLISATPKVMLHPVKLKLAINQSPSNASLDMSTRKE